MLSSSSFRFSIRRWTSPTVLRGTITPGMPSACVGSGRSTCARRWPSVATARRVAVLRRAGGVQIDTVEVIAGLFRRNRKLRAVDQALHVGGGAARTSASFRRRRDPGNHFSGKRLQREARTAGADRQNRAVAIGFQHDLRAIRQFAHDVVKHMRGHGGGTGGSRLRRPGFP